MASGCTAGRLFFCHCSQASPAAAVTAAAAAAAAIAAGLGGSAIWQQGALQLPDYGLLPTAELQLQLLLLLLLQDWVGQPYGSRVHCRPPGRGWVYLLAPTAELWTQVGAGTG
jgi:hypothetical protein